MNIEDDDAHIIALPVFPDDDLTAAQQTEYATHALRHANDLNDYYLGVDRFPIKSSRRQFERYVKWWGTAAFTEALGAHAPWRPVPSELTQAAE